MTQVGSSTDERVFTYQWQDVVLYALGIGARRQELDYLYEGEDQAGPLVYPSFAVIPSMPVVFECLQRTGGDPAMIVHGSQKLVMHKPLASSGELRTRATLEGIYDARRMAQVKVTTQSKDGSGELVAETEWTIIYRDAGGFDGPRPPRKKNVGLPKDRGPDFVFETATAPEQALLYRLSGDHNPLHADPAFAARVGFDQGPILHGLCTYGVMARGLIHGLLGGEAGKLRSLDAQFRKPVWPGETLVVEGSRLGEAEAGITNVAVRVKVKERDEVVIPFASAEVAEG